MKRKRNGNINWLRLKNEYMRGNIISVQEFLRQRLGKERALAGNTLRHTAGWRKEKVEREANALRVSEQVDIQKRANMENRMLMAIDKAQSLLIADLDDTATIQDVKRRVETRRLIMEKLQIDSGIPVEGVKRIAILKKEVPTLSQEEQQYIEALTQELPEEPPQYSSQALHGV